MKLIDYIFSLNVTIDYNEENQEDSTPEQKDAYDDTYRKTFFYQPFGEVEFRSIYNTLLKDYISVNTCKDEMSAALEQDFEKEEICAFIKRFSEATNEGAPFYDRFHGIDISFILFVPATVIVSKMKRNQIYSAAVYQVNVEFEDPSSDFWCNFWYENLYLMIPPTSRRTQLVNANAKNGVRNYTRQPKYEVRNGEAIIPQGTDTIVPQAFDGCEALKRVVIPESVKTIGMGAFGECINLTKLIIPVNVETIDYSTFFASGLVSVDIQAPVTIPQWAFIDCKKLTTVTLTEGIKKIEKEAFKNCSALKTITLPAGIGKISGDVFDGCSALKAINVPAKKADYYKKRLPENLHSLIVELPAEKKVK